MATERECMERAVEKARMSRSEAGKISPKVGAVAWKNGSILGDAFRGEDEHQKEHAEFRLLKNRLPSSTTILAGSTIYTTLEPCFKRGSGKTPCAQRLINRRVERVVIGMLDPDPTVHGKGQMLLLEHGIKVGSFDPDLTSQILEMNEDFIKDRQNPMFTITSPEDGQAFSPGEIKLRGRYRNNPAPGKHYAVLTRRGKQYWPQGRFVIHHDQTWECTLNESHPGETTILITQMDPGAYLWVQHFAKVVEKKNQWVGLDIEMLPDSIEVNHQITIKIG